MNNIVFDVYKFAKNLMPEGKRGRNALAALYAFVEVPAYLKKLILDIFKNGSADAVYAAGTYAARARVVYRLGVFESLTDGNVYSPANTETWRKLQDLHVGAAYRAGVNGNKLILEYALNKIFKTTFVDPPTYGDIYLTTAADSVGSFTSGENEDESSTVEPEDSSEFVFETEASVTRLNFSVYIPVADFTALGTTTAAREGVVRSVVDRFICAGLYYDVITY